MFNRALLIVAASAAAVAANTCNDASDCQTGPCHAQAFCMGKQVRFSCDAVILYFIPEKKSRSELLLFFSFFWGKGSVTCGVRKRLPSVCLLPHVSMHRCTRHLLAVQLFEVHIICQHTLPNRIDLRRIKHLISSPTPSPPPLQSTVYHHSAFFPLPQTAHLATMAQIRATEALAQARQCLWDVAKWTRRHPSILKTEKLFLLRKMLNLRLQNRL